MDDRIIVELFWQRSPQALDALDTTYGSTLRKLAENLLGSRQDAEECVKTPTWGCGRASLLRNPIPCCHTL